MPDTHPPHNAADICRELLRELPGSRDVRKPLAVAWARFRCQPHLYAPALLSCLTSGAGESDRVAAACLMHTLGTNCPYIRGASDWVVASVPEVVRFIDSADADTRFFVCRLLAHGTVPPEALSPLRRMVRTRSDDAAIAAAVVLSRIGSRSAQAVRLLDQGLSNSRLDIADAAGEALAALVEHRPDAGVAYFRALASSDRAIASSAIKAAANSRLPRAKVVAALSRAVADESTDRIIRSFAASKLGEVAKTDTGIVQLIATALCSDDPFVMEGAARGIKAAGRCPAGAADALIRHLESPSPDVRLAALRSLAAIGPGASPAAESLVKLIETENSEDAIPALGEALAACGEDIIEPLIPIIRRQDFALVPAIGIALTQLGPRAALRALNRFKAENDTWGLALVFGIAREMGPAAAAMVPVLGEMLEVEQDEAIAGMLLTAIHSTGVPAKDAIPGLLKCLLLGGPELADRAERALRAVGPEIRPVIEELVGLVAPESRDRLLRLLDATSQSKDPRFAPFLAFDDDATLERFTLAAELLSERGQVSYKEMESILQDRKVRGFLSHGCSTSASSLRQAIASIESDFKLRTTTRIPGRKGQLTPEALKLLHEVKMYLEHKAHFRAHH